MSLRTKRRKWGRGRWLEHKEARKHGWHSRRHETNEAHTAARERWRSERGREARQKRAQERAMSGKDR